MASIYKRGNVWWVKYFRPGSRKPIRVTLDVTDEAQARKKLKILEGELAKGNSVDIRAERIRFGHLLDLVLLDYTNNERRSYKHAKCRIEGTAGDKGHIRPALGDRRAMTINSADISLYVDDRKKAGASNGTVNRELVLIKKAFTLAWRAYRLPGPYIELLDEDNVREGFFDRTQLETLCRHLPGYLVPVARFAFLTGWRLAEIRNLQWKDIDFEAGEIRLAAGKTKNKDGRVFKMTTDLRRLLQLASTPNSSAATKGDGMKSPQVPTLTPFVFTYTTGGKKAPIKVRPIGDHRKVWAKACKAAGLPGRIFHDFRRSAVRQFVRQGIPERVAMSLTGHRTREVFERYNIVSEGDLEAAREKMEGTIAGTADPVKSRKRTPNAGVKR